MGERRYVNAHDVGERKEPNMLRKRYLVLLGLSFAVVFVTAYILEFIEMALLDAGVI
jgi:hypothetical protein